METLRNFAIGDTKRRVGKSQFTTKSFYDLAHESLGKTQAFAMFLSYGESFAEHVEAQGYRSRGWSGAEPAYFVDFPVDFDASENLPLALRDTRQFVETELIGKGIDTRYFVIYLSGGKGFHVHISASVLDAEQPIANAGYRLKELAKRWAEKYKTLDLSIYNSTALFRLPGSRHKSGLHKVEIPLDLLTLEHFEGREKWAAEPPTALRIPERGKPPVTLSLPEARVAPALPSYDILTDFDPSARITPSCPWLQRVLADPSNEGRDGLGREKRRDAIGILLSAHPLSDDNPELKWFIGELENHPYMDAKRMGEVHKWVREYDRDGEIKCKKSCYSLGCSAPQRKACGTKSPLDWLIKQRRLKTVSVQEARLQNADTVRRILEADGNGVYLLPWPVGIGKTHTLMQQISEGGLTAFCVSATHQLAMQTHHNFLNRGLTSRHIASRNYLAEHEGFECLALAEVNLAVSNGYEAFTICGKCPRFPKKEKGVYEAQGEGFEPCDYYMQFNDLDKLDAVCGVHQHLYEHLYKSADVAGRSITVIDESPFSALGREYPALPTELLTALTGTLEAIEAELSAPVNTKPASKGGGLFGAARAVLQAALDAADSDDTRRRLRFLGAVLGAFRGLPIDTAWLASLDPAYLRAQWYELATDVALRAGLGADLPEGVEYLAVPYVLPAAIQLQSIGQHFDPLTTQYLPVTLPPNKLVILDATASSDVYAEVVARFSSSEGGRPFEFVQHPLVEQPHSRVLQITSSSYGVSRLYDEAVMTRLGVAAQAIARRHPGKGLIVCHKQHANTWRATMKEFPMVDVAHFGSLKGLNHWQDCKFQIIVGTPFVPDSGVKDLADKLGNIIPLSELESNTRLKSSLLLAKDGSTAIVQRRIYANSQFHTELAKMYSQWEVTQAVRLRLYDQSIDETQHLYIFSNVELRGMYADTYMTMQELGHELAQEAKEAEREEMLTEFTGTAYLRMVQWFNSLPLGAKFKSSAVPEELGLTRYIRQWLLAATEMGWVTRTGYTYCKVKQIATNGTKIEFEG